MWRDCEMNEEDYYLSLSRISINWKLSEQEIEFSVRHVKFPKNIASLVYREDEEGYVEACGRVFTIPFFDVRVKGDIAKYQPIYLKAIRSTVAAKVRIIVLSDKLREIDSRIKKFQDLISKCEEKLNFSATRANLYEAEMNFIGEMDGQKVTKSNRFCAMLCKSAGFICISKALLREQKRLLTSTSNILAETVGDVEPTWEEIHKITVRQSMDEIVYCWQLLQIWQILNSVRLKCRCGNVGYPVTASVSKSKRSQPSAVLPILSVPLKALRDMKGQNYDSAEFDTSVIHNEAPPSVLQSIIAGSGVGVWEDVCDTLGCSDRSNMLPSLEDDEELVEESMLHKVCVAAFELVKSQLVEIVDRPSCNLVATAMADLNPSCTDAPEMADSLWAVISNIAFVLEEKLLLRLRTIPLWIAMLTDLRKERVKNEGGKLVVREHGDVEISLNGAMRTIPFADDFIDSDVLHGSLQRIKVLIALPQAQVALNIEINRAKSIRSERSCLPQLLYSIALPLLQRNIRAAIIRKRYLPLRHELIWSAVHAAASTLQALVRGRRGRSWYRLTRYNRRHQATVSIQKIFRGFNARKRFKVVQGNELDNNKNAAAIKLQALIRGVLSRRRVQELILAGSEETKKQEANWAAIVIQRFARGFISRKTIVRSYRLRNMLSKPVLKLTEKYLKTGDLWRFLSEIDGIVKRLGNELEETNTREDAWADTFVKKVVDKRKNEFDGVWNSFHEAISGASTLKTATDHVEIDVSNSNSNGSTTRSVVTQDEPVISAVAASISGPVLKSSKAHRIQLHSIKSSQISQPESGIKIRGGNASGPIPGVFLRRAISASVSEGVIQTMDGMKNGKSRLLKQTEAVKNLYESKTISPTKLGVAKATKKNKVALTAQLNRKQEPKGKIAAFHSDWVSSVITNVKINNSGNFHAESSLDDQYQRQSMRENAIEESMSPSKQILAPVKLGDFLLLDIPRGIDDKLERLLNAASLRCYIPEFFPHHSLQEAYAIYRQLPHGLAKIRYEQTAFQWCQPIINNLKLKGLNNIIDLLPFSKGAVFLRNAGASPSLIRTTEDIIGILMKIGTFPLGVSHLGTKEKTLDLLSKDTIKVLERSSDFNNELEVTGDFYAPSKDIAGISISKCESSMSRNFSFGSRFADSFLKSTVSGGSWSAMNAPVDELLLHAAFLICDNVALVDETLRNFRQTLSSSNSTMPRSAQYQMAAEALGDGYKNFKRIEFASEFNPHDYGPDKFDKMTKMYCEDTSTNQIDVFGNDKNITLHGHDSFLSFATYLDYIASDACRDLKDIELDQREAIRERYKTALLLSTPFELHLKANGVNSVQQLIRFDLECLELPPLYRTQIEALINTAISTATGAKAPSSVNAGLHLPPVNNQIAFKVPLVYNNKFQRSPFDPYGIPPRLAETMSGGGLKKIPKRSALSQTPNKLSTANVELIVPTGLWQSTTVGADDNMSLQAKKEDFTLEESIEMSGSTQNFGNDMSGAVKHSKRSGLKSRFGASDVTKKYDSNSLGSPASLTPQMARALRDSAELKGTYDRPYKCLHKGCTQGFSRPYTLKMHQQCHLAKYKDYMKYRNDPQYCYDDDEETHIKNEKQRLIQSSSLSETVESELNYLIKISSKEAF